jgi:hypothetical protein
MKFIVGLTLCFTIAGGAAMAQSLAQLAKKEKERREKLHGEKAKTFTDRDLTAVEGAGTPVTASSSAPAASEDEEATSTDTESEESEQEDPTQTREYWQDRLRPIDQRIAELQARLASPELTANPRGASERQRVESDLAAARAQRQAIVEEARHKGVPPGWVR